jgi:hypothetical protein
MALTGDAVRHQAPELNNLRAIPNDRGEGLADSRVPRHRKLVTPISRFHSCEFDLAVKIMPTQR